jgi:acetyl-CoA synthetase
MRRLLRDLAAGKEVSGDTSTLEDRSVLDKLRGSDSISWRTAHDR